MYLANPRFVSVRRLLLLAVCLAAAFPQTLGAAPDDPFTGSWTGRSGPGSTLQLSIGAAGGSGVRQVTFSVQGGEHAGPNVACIAHGTGTVSLTGSGDAYTLSGKWRSYRCESGAIDAGGFGFLRPVSTEIIFSGGDHLFKRGS